MSEPETAITTSARKPAHRIFWRRLLRFDLGMMICFLLALNLVVLGNWKLRTGYRDVMPTQDEKRVVLRPRYIVGWPWPFLRLNGIQQRLTTNTDADREPRVEILSWADAAKSAGVNAVLTLVLGLLFLRLKMAIFSENPRRAPAQRTARKIPAEFV